MPNEKHNTKKLESVDSNMLKSFIMRGRLIMRLMNDPRIGFMYKLLPFASLAYLIWPLDFIPIPGIGAADDIAVMWFGFTLFVELCPPAIVDEHLATLTGRVVNTADGDVVEGEVSEVD